MFSGGESPKYKSLSPGFNNFANEMDRASQRYQGYVDTGNKARDMSMDQYSKLISNPNFLQDMVSKGFSESPYQQYITDMTQKRMNMNAANTGMLGSGAANRALSNEINTMTGQFMNDYINRGMGSYSQGLGGLNNLSQMGLSALNSQDPLLEQAAAGRLKGYTSDVETDQRNAEMKANQGNNMLGTGLGIAGGIIGGMYGGPMGASIGSSLGSSVGGAMSGNKGGAGGGMGGGFNPMAMIGGGKGGGFNPMQMFGGGGGGSTMGLNFAQAGQGQLPIPFSGGGGGGMGAGGWSY